MRKPPCTIKKNKIKGLSRSPERELKKEVALSFHMDSCWQNTPKEIVNYILKLACGRLIYRDNRYIEIGKLVCKNTQINKYVTDRFSLNQHFEHDLENGGWYLDIRFEGHLYENGVALRHGLCFDYNFNYNNLYEFCYWSDRESESGPWTQIRTIME